MVWIWRSPPPAPARRTRVVQSKRRRKQRPEDMRFGIIVAVALAATLAPGEALDVTCGTDGVDVTLTPDDKTDIGYNDFNNSKTAINSSRVTAAGYSSIAEKCKADNGINDYSFNLNDCDPQMTQMDDMITYIWTLWLVIPDEDFGLVARFKQACIKFSCKYNATLLADASFQPTIAKLDFSTSATGYFSFSMNLYHDVGHNMLIGNDPVVVPNVIYAVVTLHLSDPGTLKAQVRHCWTSKSPDPYESPDPSRYTIINNYCVAAGTTTTITKQGADVEAHFNFESFVYSDERDNPGVIFVHCLARACKTFACIAGCSPIPSSRKRRALGGEAPGELEDDDANTETVTYGPIILKAPPRTCSVNNGRCDDVCTMVGDKAVCSCGGGRTLAENGRSCVNEIQVDLAVHQQDTPMNLDATRLVGMMILLLSAISATVLITLSCKRPGTASKAFQAV